MKLLSRIVSVAVCACMVLSIIAAASAESENLAYGKATIDYGKHQGDNVSSYITDGYRSGDEAKAAGVANDSRWAAETTHEDQATTGEWWVGVDFGEATTFDKIVIYWEVCYGKQFKIQTSNDAAEWTDVSDVITNSSASRQEITLDNPATAKYMRVFITEKDNSWGVSMYELEAYNTDGETTPPQTGVESVAVWALVLFGAACIAVFCTKKVKA